MKKDIEDEYVDMDFKVDGQIGAGSVVPIFQDDRTITVPIPAKIAKRGNVGMMRVSGNSLVDERIFDGDLLVYKKNVTNRDLKPQSICAVYIITTGELLAKKVRYQEGRVALIPAAKGYPTLYYEPDQIEVRGIVFQRVGFVGPNGNFGPGDDEIPI